ncbi:N/A [soil metagenome]
MSDSIRFRFANPDEIADVGLLVSHSFPGQDRPPTWWHEQLRDPIYGGGADTLMVGEQNGRLIAACQLHPLRQWVGGELLPMGGIGTVAISPTHRKRSIGAELVTHALRACRERGDLASALYPFRVAFYQKLGYGSAGESLQYLLPPEALPSSPERDRVEILSSQTQRTEALELYQQWARTQTGQLQRSARVWAGLCDMTDHALIGYRGATGELQGYALVTYRTDLSPEKRYLEVDELIWVTLPARRGLYGWLSSLGDQWQQIMLRALPEHRLGDWLREPRLPRGAAPGWGLWSGAATLMMGPMFRLLDLEGSWAVRKVDRSTSLRVGLVVADAQLSGNQGSWRLHLEEGSVQVERGESGRADLTLTLEISTLSRLFAGSLSPSQALGAELLQCDRPDRIERLDTALKLPQPWTFDRF